MTDIVARLRKQATRVSLATEASPADDLSDGLTKAADEIERLRSEIDLADLAYREGRLVDLGMIFNRVSEQNALTEERNVEETR